MKIIVKKTTCTILGSGRRLLITQNALAVTNTKLYRDFVPLGIANPK